MNKRLGFQLSFGIATLLFCTALHAEATFKILAVKHNPTCGRRGSPHFGERCGRDFECDSTPRQGDGLCIGGIIPTNTLNVLPGDTIVAEVYVSDWSPNGESFRMYQVRFDLGSFFDDCPGGITVYGWTNRREECEYCEEDVVCRDGEVCHETRRCYPPDHDPTIGVFIDTDRLDWAFSGFTHVIDAIEYCTLMYGATLILPGGPVYDGRPVYLASIVLNVLPNSGGRYEIRLSEPDQGVHYTFLRDGNRHPIVSNLQPLTLVSPGVNGLCGICSADSSDPPHCSIDARQTSEADGSPLPGSDSMGINFLSTPEIPCDRIPTVDEFTVRQVPFGNPPRISSVDWDDATSTATINFDRRISPQQWTCVTYIGREPFTEFCMGYLPGDVDGNGSTNATDVLSVIDNLNGVVDPPLAIWQCDVDRSGVCSASDILRVIDLLNGADQYHIWLGATIDACPRPR